MTIWTCATCAIEHPDAERPPEVCAICADERQWIPVTGQAWTTQAELAAAGHRITVERLEPDLHGVIVTPRLGINQRGLLLRRPEGNLLFDPPGFLDAECIAAIAALGGVSVIASSHPHLTGASIQWSHAFGGAPVLVAADDAEWIRRPDPVIERWSGECELLRGRSCSPRSSAISTSSSGRSVPESYVAPVTGNRVLTGLKCASRVQGVG